jgi:hypothetical protein
LVGPIDDILLPELAKNEDAKCHYKGEPSAILHCERAYDSASYTRNTACQGYYWIHLLGFGFVPVELGEQFFHEVGSRGELDGELAHADHAHKKHYIPILDLISAALSMA